jgi:hypothetical protein
MRAPVNTDRAAMQYPGVSILQEYEQHLSDRVSSAMLSSAHQSLHSHTRGVGAVWKILDDVETGTANSEITPQLAMK